MIITPELLMAAEISQDESRPAEDRDIATKLMASDILEDRRDFDANREPLTIDRPFMEEMGFEPPAEKDATYFVRDDLGPEMTYDPKDNTLSFGETHYENVPRWAVRQLIEALENL